MALWELRSLSAGRAVSGQSASRFRVPLIMAAGNPRTGDPWPLVGVLSRFGRAGV